MTGLLIEQLKTDLDTQQLANIGPTEAAIFWTPEGTPYVDVLAKKSSSPILTKNSRDYDTLKWEQEVRATLEQKKGVSRKLTAEEQSLVAAQIDKEKIIRRQVKEIASKLRRGVGIIRSLATGPPTDTASWFGTAVALLHSNISQGVALLLNDAAELAYLDCAQQVSSRLGALRRFVGIASLRGMGEVHLPQELTLEPLNGKSHQIPRL